MAKQCRRVWRPAGLVIPEACTAAAIAHDDLAAREVEVLDAQLQALLQPQARSVEQARHEPVHARQVSEHPLHLPAREDDRKPGRPARAHDRVEPGQRRLERLAVQEEDGGERLVLRAGGNLAFNGQVGQEPLDVPGPSSRR